MKKLDARGKGEFVYDYKYDILTFKIKDRNYKLSVELQNFVADIDEEGFVTGIRIMDASKVFNVTKYLLKSIIQWEFNASMENNVITIVFKFISKVRNKIIPLFSEKQNFTQQITTPIEGSHNFVNSAVVCPA